MQYIRAQHAVFAGQSIEHHLGAGRAVGVIQERMALTLGVVIVDIGRGVKARGGQGDAVHVGLLDKVGPVQTNVARHQLVVLKAHRALLTAVFGSSKGDQPGLDLLAGIQRRHAVKVRAGGGGRWRGVGHLVGTGCGDLDLVHVDLEGRSDYLRNFDIQALAHLGAAMIHLQAAVGVDQHQRAGLVEVLGGEGNTKLHRRQRQPALEHRALLVEGTDLGAARLIVRAGFQLVDQLGQHMMGNGLAVMGGVAAFTVEVALAHLQRVQLQVASDVIHRLLDHHHALRATKAAEGRVGHRVRLAAMAGDPRLIQIVGVVGVEHGPLDNGVGQVRRVATAPGHHDLRALNHALLVKADVVGVEKVVALAGLHHVIGARQSVLHRTLGGVGQQGGHTGDRRSLGFLAAKAAAHATYRGGHRVNRQPQYLGHQLLHLGGVLAGGMHKHAAVFLRQCHTGLTFQVKVLLPADIDFALETMRRAGQCRVRVTALLGVAGADKKLLLQRLAGVQHRVQGFVLDLGQLGRLARRRMAGGRHGKQRLADMFDQLARQHRVTRKDRADVGMPRHVTHGQHRDHAGVGAHGRQIDAQHPRMGLFAVAHRRVQNAFRLGQVIDVAGGAGHVQPGTLMQGALTSHTQRLAALAGNIAGQFTHSRSPSMQRCRQRQHGIHRGHAAAGCRPPWCGSWPRRAHRTAG